MTETQEQKEEALFEEYNSLTELIETTPNMPVEQMLLHFMVLTGKVAPVLGGSIKERKKLEERLKLAEAVCEKVLKFDGKRGGRVMEALAPALGLFAIFLGLRLMLGPTPGTTSE